MRKLLILLIIALVFCLALASCIFKDKGNEPKEKYAQTAAFNLVLGDDDTWMIDSVTSHAFKEITIPESYNGTPITTIKKDAFAGCSSIKEIRIPHSITYIGSGAFAGCSQLEEIYISNKDATVAKSAFEGCPIKSAQVPSSHIKVLPTTSLEELYLIDGTVERAAFSSFYSLHTIAVAGSVTFEENALEGCNAITFKLPPEKIKSFPEKARVHRLIISPSLVINPSMRIDLKAFEGYTTLGSITFEHTGAAYEFADNAFEGCRATSFTIDASLLGSLPTTVETLTITSGEIKQLGSTRNLNLKTLVIKSGVTAIEQAAFRECLNLTSVSILANVNAIGYQTFFRCSSLINIEIGPAIKTIGESAFASCTALEKVELGANIARLERNAFKDCTSLLVLNLKSNVKTVLAGAFENCSTLTTLTIGSGLENLDLSAFIGCPAIKYINLSEENKSYVFVDGALLTKDKKTLVKFTNFNTTTYAVPNTVEVINDEAFYGNINLMGVAISNSVVSIGKSAFKNCTALRVVTVGTSLEKIGEEAFRGCELLDSISFPASLKSIGKSSFYNCKALNSITFENGIKEIGDTAFYNCDAVSYLVLPKSLSSLGERVFASCESLEKIYVDSIEQLDSFNSHNDRWINGCGATIYTVDDLPKEPSDNNQ